MTKLLKLKKKKYKKEKNQLEYTVKFQKDINFQE